MRPEIRYPRAGAPARAALFTLLAALLLVTLAPRAARAQQKLSGFERDRVRQMLDMVKDDIKKHYYDPTYRGIDLDAHFAAAAEKLKQAASLGHAMSIVAQALLDFDDSHTYFVPPERSAQYEYGWRFQMVGDKCLVTEVKPGSDAEKKGLRPGDEVYSIDGFEPTRENLWKMQYLYYSLRPQPGMRLVVTKPGGEHHQYDVLAKVREGKRVRNLTASGAGADLTDMLRDMEDSYRDNRDRYVEVGEALLVWKMSEFDLEDKQVDEMMSRARKAAALVLDLRGNGGGYETTLLRLVGHFFDRDVKIGDIKRRKETKPLVAKTRGADRVFTGKLVVLVDSRSGSAAELFARVVQIEGRGTVVGDRTAGAVMRSRFHEHQSGVDIVAFYGASVTDADVVMTDGKSLEHVGVTPDKLLLPTAADIAAGRDPVLAHAATLVGVKLDPEKAGTFFPQKWQN